MEFSFSLTTFSPSGKLVQIEHALSAVSSGTTSLGIKATNGIVIATEKKTSSLLVDDSIHERVAVVCPNIGLVYSGMSPDFRVLLTKARKSAQAYWKIYGEYPTTRVLTQELATVMQSATQSGGVRPYGVSLLVAGWDHHRGASLFQVDPSGSFWAWKASANGKNMVNAKTFLEKRLVPSSLFKSVVLIISRPLDTTMIFPSKMLFTRHSSHSRKGLKASSPKRRSRSVS